MTTPAVLLIDWSGKEVCGHVCRVTVYFWHNDDIQCCIKIHLRWICAALCLHHVCLRHIPGDLPQQCRSSWFDCQSHDHAGLLSCQARMHQPWQGSPGLTGPALQAWITVVDVMEDEDGEVSGRILLLCSKSVEPCSRQPQPIGRQPQAIGRQPHSNGSWPPKPTSQLSRAAQGLATVNLKHTACLSFSV